MNRSLLSPWITGGSSERAVESPTFVCVDGRVAFLSAAGLAAAGAAVAMAGGGADRQVADPPALVRPTAVRPAGVQAQVRTPARRVAPPQQHGRVDVLRTSPPSASHCVRSQPPTPEHPTDHRQWLSGVTITEYYPALERWFTGRRITAPGLPSRYAADFLYSARGLAMEGDGIDDHGRLVHIAQLGSTGWVNAAGRPTIPVCLGKWSNGFPVWLIGGWRNRRGAVTFPLSGGGWSNGRGVTTRRYGGVTFGPYASELRYYHSIAVDPRLIPEGSRVYIPAYLHINGGWFVAQDTGGAIKGHHIDVYRPPPLNPRDEGRYLTSQRILVIPPP